MRNHWLKVHEQKHKGFWTAEFSDYNHRRQSLKARQVGVVDPKRSLGYFGATSGIATIDFKDSMLSSTDHELLDFLTEARKTMMGWVAYLRFYQGLNSEVEYFDLRQLRYVSVGMGNSADDVRFAFEFNDLHHFYVA